MREGMVWDNLPPPLFLPTINQLKEGFAILMTRTKGTQGLKYTLYLTLVFVFCS
jgi:hypothetical protein